MKEFEFDINEFIKTAKQLGIKVELNSKNPGMYIVDKNGNEKEITFEDIFPELKVLKKLEELEEKMFKKEDL